MELDKIHFCLVQCGLSCKKIYYNLIKLHGEKLMCPTDKVLFRNMCFEIFYLGYRTPKVSKSHINSIGYTSALN